MLYFGANNELHQILQLRYLPLKRYPIVASTHVCHLKGLGEILQTLIQDVDNSSLPVAHNVVTLFHMQGTKRVLFIL